MSFLQPEVLLAIFKNLDSKEMLNIRTVSQFWFQLIDENKTLWRSFKLLIDDLGDQQRQIEEVEVKDGNGDENENEKSVVVRKVSTVELFDRKSQSGLEEVSMDGSPIHWQDVDQLVEILSRSKETLRILNFVHPYHNGNICDLSWRLPHLVDCRLLSKISVNKIRLAPKMPLIDESNHLKVLWIPYCKELFGSHLYLLDNLSSLKVESWGKGSEWRSILDKPSRTLKHLTIKVSRNNNSIEISDLLFPALQVLEIESIDNRFPSWFKISSPSFTLINNATVLSSLPSISTLWVEDIRSINQFASQCPELMIIRANVKGPSREERKERKERNEREAEEREEREKRQPRGEALSPLKVSAPWNQLASERAPRRLPPDPGVNLIRALEQRKRNVDDGMEVEGIKMKQFKTLIVPFGALDEKELKKLRGLVGEVIDLKTTSRFIEVEI